MNNMVKESLMLAVKFYGSIVSTTGIDEATKKTANKNIKRAIDALNTDFDQLVAQASGLTLVTDEED